MPNDVLNEIKVNNESTRMTSTDMVSWEVNSPHKNRLPPYTLVFREPTLLKSNFLGNPHNIKIFHP